jgi:hypothetical protein
MAELQRLAVTQKIVLSDLSGRATVADGTLHWCTLHLSLFRSRNLGEFDTVLFVFPVLAVKLSYVHVNGLELGPSLQALLSHLSACA